MFGCGCYWGTERYFNVNFQKKFPGCIIDRKVGFMSPNANAVQDPSYRDVCTGKTGHVEVLQIFFDPQKATYEELVKFFFTFHDPTTLNK